MKKETCARTRSKVSEWVSKPEKMKTKGAPPRKTLQSAREEVWHSFYRIGLSSIHEGALSWRHGYLAYTHTQALLQIPAPRSPEYSMTFSHLMPINMKTDRPLPCFLPSFLPFCRSGPISKETMTLLHSDRRMREKRREKNVSGLPSCPYFADGSSRRKPKARLSHARAAHLWNITYRIYWGHHPSIHIHSTTFCSALWSEWERVNSIFLHFLRKLLFFSLENSIYAPKLVFFCRNSPTIWRAMLS